MGGSQSTRKLTISNNDPNNVIKVSDAVVQRFRGEAEAANKSDAQPTSLERQNVAPPVTFPNYPPPSISPHQYLTSNAYQPRITSLQVRQEKEAELRANDQHWQRRINEMEETHDQINQLMEQEYNNAMNEVKSNYVESGKNRNPVCVDGKNAVMKCYKEYPREPMKCAQVVQEFAACVDQHRSAIVANRG